MRRLESRNRGEHRRLLENFCMAGFVLAVLLGGLIYHYQRACDAVCNDTVRLHILANSDSAADQALKLQVRDALLPVVAQTLCGAADKAEAVETLQSKLPLLQATARQALRRQGSGQTVRLSLETAEFPPKDYGDFALPGGQYMALRVLLGQGKGHNWFCVLYPGLCVGVAQARYPTAAENAVVFGRYEIHLAGLDAVRSRWSALHSGNTAGPRFATLPTLRYDRKK